MELLVILFLYKLYAHINIFKNKSDFIGRCPTNVEHPIK